MMRIVFVNGYGAPKDPNIDANCMRYLTPVLGVLAPGDVVFLSGGRTNRPDLSEAEAMEQWFDWRKARCPARVRFVRSADDVLRSKDGLRAFRRLVDQRYGPQEILVFCEHSRAPSMRFLASRVLKGLRWRLCPVDFDLPSMRILHRLQQWTVKPILEIAAWYLPPIDRLAWWLRHRHIARKRAKR